MVRGGRRRVASFTSSCVDEADTLLLLFLSVFVLEISNLLPEDLVSFTKLLALTTQDWEKARDKGKPPKPKLDFSCLDALHRIVQKKTELYPTSLEVRHCAPSFIDDLRTDSH